MRRATRSVCVAILAVIATSSLTSPGRAGNPITVGSLSLVANYHTAQFRLNYTGDDNKNATVLVRYSKIGNSFKPTKADTGVVPFRDAARLRFTGVIPWLDPGVAYYVHVDVNDPDGGSTSLDGSVTTRTAPGHPIPTNAIYVSPSGDDANPGTLALPKRTINGAYNALGGPGGQIRVQPGIYYETAWLQKEGTAANYYSLVGNGNPDSVIIDGSEPTLLNATWTPYIDSGGMQINNIYFKVFTGAANVRNIVAGWGQRLHTKQSMDELVNFGSYPNFPSQGWFRSGDTLFVRLEGGADPSLTTMHVGIRWFGVRITGNFWRVESLTVRFTSDKAYFLGTWWDPPSYAPTDSFATGTVLRNCRGYTNGQQHVYGNIQSDSVLVDSCYFEDGRLDSWSYYASKARFEENATGLTAVGKNWVVRNSTFTGTSNGVQITGDVAKVEWGSDSDIYDCRITNQTDDGIENDLGNGVNQAIWGNLVTKSNFGLSPNPIYTGPMYVMYNVFDSEDQGALKMGGGTTAAIFYYHNIFTSGSCTSTIEHVGGGYKNQVFRNNVMVGVLDAARNCWRYVLQDGSAGMDTTVTTFGPLLDNDLWYAPNSPPFVAWWNGQNRTWSYIQGSLGWEAHGISAAPAFVDSAADNFRPATGSIQIDHGAPIQGINTRNKTGSRLYTGFPDLGAYEFGLSGSPAAPPFTAEPAVEPEGQPAPEPVSFALSTAWPNPTRGGVRFRLTLPAPAPVRAEIYDPAGRRVSTLARGEVFPAGRSELEWVVTERDRGGPAAGIYFLRVSTRFGMLWGRIVRLK